MPHHWLIWHYIYRPQRSCGQGNIFTPVCHSVHRGGLPHCMLGCHPPAKETPPAREAPLPRRPPRRRHPPAKETPPRRRHPWKEAPPQKETPLEGGIPLWKEAPPPREASPRKGHPPPGTRSMSGRYASYWNAFLLSIISSYAHLTYPPTPVSHQADSASCLVVKNSMMNN